jgi:hypothetical protein
MIFDGSGKAQRQTIMNIPSQHQAIIMASAWAQTPVTVRPILALHESLDLSHYDDENYQLSTTLWQLDQSKDPQELQNRLNSSLADPIRNLKTNKSDPRYLEKEGGGATGVGSGGDELSIDIKMALLIASNTFYSNHPFAWVANLQKMILNLPIDPTFIVQTNDDMYEIDSYHLDPQLFFKINDSPLSVSLNRARMLNLPADTQVALVHLLLQQIMIHAGQTP